ncbi:hypothetical protein TSAR_011916 [Trichomalopsis sarcophagae]|uniref:Uncharacterized protein n=1 Tax=Trichomalopsis sarcophagae TaxID=543379 RepID=A0A232F2Q9_9HYME|nr:hypothetical protein TSAR_011916 [Trichomalopsis sarcophagae]
MNAIVESQKARQALIIAGVISLIFIMLDLLRVFVPLGLDEVIRRQRQATLFKRSSIFSMKKLINASTIATQVDVDLEEDKNNLYVLSGLVSPADRNKKMLLMDSPIMRARLVPSFRNAWGTNVKTNTPCGTGMARKNTNIQDTRESDVMPPKRVKRSD